MSVWPSTVRLSGMTICLVGLKRAQGAANQRLHGSKLRQMKVLELRFIYKLTY